MNANRGNETHLQSFVTWTADCDEQSGSPPNQRDPGFHRTQSTPTFNGACSSPTPEYIYQLQGTTF